MKTMIENLKTIYPNTRIDIKQTDNFGLGKLIHVYVNGESVIISDSFENLKIKIEKILCKNKNGENIIKKLSSFNFTKYAVCEKCKEWFIDDVNTTMVFCPNKDCNCVLKRDFFQSNEGFHQEFSGDIHPIKLKSNFNMQQSVILNDLENFQSENKILNERRKNIRIRGLSLVQLFDAVNFACKKGWKKK